VETFHAGKNLIVGRNHTGKSTIIKTLFLTLGARPQGELAQWDQSTVSLVSFNIDDVAYYALHQSNIRALFSSSKELLAVARSSKEWSAALSALTGFNLVLTGKKLETADADYSCFFLPFYINQDGSWQAKWDTFAGIQQYKEPVSSILEYFSGVKPPEYYEVNAEKAKISHAAAELQKEKVFLERARDRFSKSVSLTGPKLDAGTFAQDIEHLTKEVTTLNGRQEEVRDVAVRERELLENIRLQINLATDTLKAHDSDSSYLLSSLREKLVCPTCGSEHERSFLDLFKFVDDARVLREMIVALQLDEVKVKERFESTNQQLRQLSTHYRRVSDVLAVRRDDLSFGDVVRSMGAEDAFRAFHDEGRLLQSDIDRLEAQIARLGRRLKELSNMKRTAEILKEFRLAYAAAEVDLNVPPSKVSTARLTSRPKLSGSGGPRSILAYYAALWSVCLGEYGWFSVPMVIDAPQQQGQDDLNLPKIISFIANKLASDTQVIVGIELETDFRFDKTIALTEPYNLLQEDKFEEVGAVVEPLLDAMYDRLVQPVRTPPLSPQL
jgi:predicted  nucleic acid-binding Zn-ribbon protein